MQKNSLHVLPRFCNSFQKNNTLLLDVRTLDEFDGPLGHIIGAVLIPIQEIEQRIDELNKHKEKEIIVICRSGNRSQTGTRILISHGFNAVNMLGGMKAWNDLQ